MTDLVIRALSKRDAHLFDTLPDPLGVGRALARATHRPDWKRVALRVDDSGRHRGRGALSAPCPVSSSRHCLSTVRVLWP